MHIYHLTVWRIEKDTEDIGDVGVGIERTDLLVLGNVAVIMQVHDMAYAYVI